MKTFRVHSNQREQVLDITSQVEDFVSKCPHKSGLVAVYCPHTTAAVSTNENADPSVKRDLIFQLKKTIPKSPDFEHSEGNSDAHIKAVLAGLSQVFIVEDGRLQLGTWQGVYFLEFDGPRDREVWLKFIPG
jgi:secondary thiamine-phosphate synthase enzyme